MEIDAMNPMGLPSLQASAEMAEALQAALQAVQGRATIKAQASALTDAIARATSAEAAYRDALTTIPSAHGEVAALQAAHAQEIAQLQAQHAQELQALQAAGVGDTTALIAQTALQERARWQTVMASDLARGKERLAVTLLAQPIPADAILEALQVAPAPSSANAFAQFMASASQPLPPTPVLTSGVSRTDPQATRAAQIAALPRIKAPT